MGGGGGEAPKQVQVPALALRSVLGFAAFHAWEVLTTLRDPRLETHATLLGVLRRRPSIGGYENAKRAMRRLRAAGLVVDLGWRKLATPGGEVDVYYRRVLGRQANGNVTIPPATAAWLPTASGWGGRRAGAGRKPREGFKCTGGGEDSSVPTDSSLAFIEGNPMLSVPSEPSAARCMSMKQDSTQVESSESASLSPPPRAVPDFPGISTVPAPYVPSPPLMDATLDEVSRVRRLLTVYDGAVRSRYKVARPPTKIGKSVLVDDPLTGGKTRATRMQDAKQFIPLVAAADALVRLEVAPAAWAAFSVDVWKRFSDGKRPPPLTWVWSRDRIMERREWFQSEENDYVGRRLVLTKAHHALLRRYTAMRYELLRSPEEQHAAIIEKHFPNDTYERLVERARRQTQDEQRRLNEQAEIGAWLW